MYLKVLVLFINQFLSFILLYWISLLLLKPTHNCLVLLVFLVFFAPLTAALFFSLSSEHTLVANF